MNGKDEHTNIDDYVSKQLESYYGKDVVSNISRTAPPPPPPRRKSRALSFGAVICAVVFLTGALMLGGVFFSGGIPVSRTDTDPGSASSAASSVNESIAESSESASSAASSVNESIAESSESASSAASSAASSEFSTSDSEGEENSAGEPSPRRSGSHALPELDESGAYVIETPEEPSPNGSVTTGRRIRAGLGIFLMLSSLASAAALYNIYADKENET